MAKRQVISASLRWRIFARDDFRCVYCGCGPTESQMHVDHRIALANGGTNDEDNLVTSCANCNLGKGTKPLRERVVNPEIAAAKLVMATEALEDVKKFWPEAIEFTHEMILDMEARGRSLQSTVLALAGLYGRLAAQAWRTGELPFPDKESFLTFCAASFDEGDEQ